MWYSENVYDTERKESNNTIIHMSKTVDNLLIPIFKSSKKSKNPPIFLSKGYAEFEDTLAVFSNTTSNARFTDSDFAVSIVVYGEDFEDSNDAILAPPVPREPQNRYFDIYFPNCDNA